MFILQARCRRVVYSGGGGGGELRRHWSGLWEGGTGVLIDIAVINLVSTWGCLGEVTEGIPVVHQLQLGVKGGVDGGVRVVVAEEGTFNYDCR